MSKIIKKVGVLVLAIFCFQAAAVAQKATFSVIPKYPKEGDTIQLVYDIRNAPWKDATSVSANLTGYQDFQWVYDDLVFEKKDSAWIASYVVPDKMSLVNLVFQADTIRDQGGEITYSYLISGDGGRQVPGAKLGWGMLRTPHIVRGVPYVVDSASYKTDEVLLMWVKYELQDYPENRFKVLYAAASALKHMGTTDALQKLNNELAALEDVPDLGEEEWLAILQVYEGVLQDSVKSAETIARIRRDFPEGKYVTDQQRLADFKKIQEAKTQEECARAAMYFVDKYPYTEADEAFNEAHRIRYVDAYWIIAVHTSMVRDLEAFKRYISKAEPYMALANVAYRAIYVPFEAQQLMDAAEILPYARVVMDRLNYYKENFEGEEYSRLYYSNAALFAKILVQNKLYDEAFVYAAAAQSTSSYEDADVNDTYVRVLEGQGKLQELRLALEESYKRNQSSTYMLDLMEKQYEAQHRSTAGYAAYLNSLKDADKSAALKEKVQQALIDEDFAGFELYDQYGKLVRSADLRGKIVVLDYWASWCAPCKAAFPGMKLAVERFQDDEDVLFFFIDTQERKDMKEYVTKYMEENNYPFTVLLDTDSKASKAAGVSAIPHKMVIGTDGRLRFSEVGYMGSASELADEITEMVNVLKAEIKK
ncbi:peroxiredoxin family protein [Sphingobacterium gobiense]|nr:TlpA disulfide reductase family protein [Sphingobacterium gobiense]